MSGLKPPCTHKISSSINYMRLVTFEKENCTYYSDYTNLENDLDADIFNAKKMTYGCNGQ